MTNFWWWEFRFNELMPALDVGTFSFLVLYSVALFAVAVILVPHQLSIVDDSWGYFLSIRAWFYGGVLVLNVVDFVDSLLKGLDWALRPNYVLYVVAVAAGCALGLSTKRRFVHLAVGTALLLWSNGLTFVELFVVGPR